MIDLDDLRTVLAVVEAGRSHKSGSIAASGAFCCQYEIAEFRKSSISNLFEKRGRQLSPTSHALALAEDARKILSLVRETESKITNEEPHGVLRLGATDHLVGDTA